MTEEAQHPEKSQTNCCGLILVTSELCQHKNYVC